MVDCSFTKSEGWWTVRFTQSETRWTARLIRVKRG